MAVAAGPPIACAELSEDGEGLPASALFGPGNAGSLEEETCGREEGEAAGVVITLDPSTSSLLTSSASSWC